MLYSLMSRTESWGVEGREKLWLDDPAAPANLTVQYKLGGLAPANQTVKYWLEDFTCK